MVRIACILLYLQIKNHSGYSSLLAESSEKSWACVPWKKTIIQPPADAEGLGVRVWKLGLSTCLLVQPMTPK